MHAEPPPSISGTRDYDAYRRAEREAMRRAGVGVGVARTAAAPAQAGCDEDEDLVAAIVLSMAEAAPAATAPVAAAAAAAALSPAPTPAAAAALAQVSTAAQKQLGVMGYNEEAIVQIVGSLKARDGDGCDVDAAIRDIFTPAQLHQVRFSVHQPNPTQSQPLILYGLLLIRAGTGATYGGDGGRRRRRGGRGWQRCSSGADVDTQCAAAAGWARQLIPRPRTAGPAVRHGV